MSDGDNSHQLICALKELASELGRTPTRDELVKSVRNGRARIDAAFGGYSTLVQAAGLDPLKSKPKKIDSSIFQVDIQKHIESYEPHPDKEAGPFPSAAIISDIHWPFCNQRVINKFYLYVSEHKPEWVLINGDAWEMYSHSKFPRSHNVFTPKEEQERSQKANAEFWQEIHRISPGSRCAQLMGNHDLRPMKRVLETYPEAADWIAEKLKSLFTFEGVTTIMDSRQELFLNESILVFHGYLGSLGAHRDHTLYSVFNGHSHVGGVVFRKVKGSTLFECNSGLAGDPQSKGLTYTPQRITKWTPGFAVMDSLGPRFIPV